MVPRDLTIAAGTTPARYVASPAVPAARKMLRFLSMRAGRRPFASVLCPVDFSKHSRVALQFASAVANRSGGTLTALFVNDPFLVAAAAAAYNERALAAQSLEELKRFVHQVGGGRAGRTAIGTSVALGEPAREIQKAVRKTAATLVVIGSEGLSGARKLFFGSTTARVLAQTAVPVLAVPPALPGVSLKSMKSTWPGRRILAAIDLGPRASADVETAAALARWFGCTLTLVHVVEKTRAPRWLSLGLGEHDRNRVAKAKARLSRLAQGCEDVRVEALVVVGETASQLAALAANTDVGLVIVTLRGADGLFGDRKGDTTYRVVCEASTPVLAVPAGWRLNHGR